MSPANALRLLLLAAIWGASFLFMRVAVPELGPVVLIALRVLLGALFLLVCALWWRDLLGLRPHFGHLVQVGLINSALPFVLIAYAAQSLNVAVLAVLNATTPIWSVLISAALGRSRLTGRVVAGLALGLAGVAVLVGLAPGTITPLAMLAALAAALSYASASLLVQRRSEVPPLVNAHGSLWTATFWLLPLVPFNLPPAVPGSGVMLSVLLLGIFCSGVAYLLYFRLVVDVGATSALTVTYLVPPFGILWGALILDEPVGLHTLAGTLMVLAGTAAVTGFRPRFGRGSGTAS